jgi:hypothetical protein
MLAALGGVVSVALPIGIVVGAVALNMHQAAQYAGDVNTQVAQMTATMSGAGTTTLPQLNTALASNRDLLHNLQQTYIQQSNATDTAGNSLQNYAKFSDAYHKSVGSITDENKKLNAEIIIQNSNLQELEAAYGLTKTQAESLASSVGLNLNRALSGLQVTQAGEYLKQLATQSGVTQSALQTLSQITGEKTADIAKSITNAENATQKAFSGSFDAIKNLGAGYTALAQPVADTSDQIAQFYSDSEAQGKTWSSDIQSLLAGGLNPAYVSQLIQAGPAQTMSLVQGLVAGEGTNLINIVNNGNAALQQQANQAVQIARLTQIAVTAPASAIAGALSNAINIQQTSAVQGMSATVVSVANTLKLGVPQVAAIAGAYGEQIPGAMSAQQGNAYLKALAMGDSVQQALAATTVPVKTQADLLAQTTPQAVAAQQAAAYIQSLLQGGQVGRGIADATQPAGAAASGLAGLVTNNMNLPSFFGVGQAAAQSMAAGLNAGASVVAATAASIAASVSSAIASVGFLKTVAPGHAAGTGMGTFQGLTWVGEKGPELVNFGSPVQIIPNDQALAFASVPSAPPSRLPAIAPNPGGRTGPAVVNEYVNINNEVGLDAFGRQMAFLAADI